MESTLSLCQTMNKYFFTPKGYLRIINFVFWGLIFAVIFLNCKAEAQVYFYDGFETDISSSWFLEGVDDYSITRVNSQAKEGNYSVRFERRCDDPLIWDGRRAELSENQTQNPYESERWYGFSVYLPSDWIDSTDDSWGTTVGQWHGRSGLVWGSPFLSFKIRTNNWYILSRYGTPGAGNFDIDDWNIGNINSDKGKWTDWVIHVKWTWTSSGFLQVWKDGELVVEKTGPTTMIDPQGLSANGPYGKFGIYQAPDSPCPRIVYHDEFRMGDENSNFEEVSPGHQTSQSYECSDGIDNDGDGLTDYPNDPGCSVPTDNDEIDVPKDFMIIIE